MLPDPASRRSLEVIQDWAYSTRAGRDVVDAAAGGADGGVGQGAVEFGELHGAAVPRTVAIGDARGALENANITVCNHHLFFSDLALRAQEAGFLPV